MIHAGLTILTAGWLALSASPACSASSAGSASPAQACDSSGIKGTVYRIGGNRMPAPNYKPGPPHGVRSTVYVYRLTHISEVVSIGQAGYYSAVHTTMVTQADTDDQGHFKIVLPPGRYSIFTKKGDLYYASRRDEKNNIAPVEVLPCKLTVINCSVASDHPPVY